MSSTIRSSPPYDSDHRHPARVGVRARDQHRLPLQASRSIRRARGRCQSPLPHDAFALFLTLVRDRHARRHGRLDIPRRRDGGRAAVGRPTRARRRGRVARRDGRADARRPRRTQAMGRPRADRKRPDPARAHASRHPRRAVSLLAPRHDRLRVRPDRRRRPTDHGPAHRRPRPAPRLHARCRGRDHVRRLRRGDQGDHGPDRNRRHRRRHPVAVGAGDRGGVGRGLLRIGQGSSGRGRRAGDRDHRNRGQRRRDRRRHHRLRRPPAGQPRRDRRSVSRVRVRAGRRCGPQALPSSPARLAPGARRRSRCCAGLRATVCTSPRHGARSGSRDARQGAFHGSWG